MENGLNNSLNIKKLKIKPLKLDSPSLPNKVKKKIEKETINFFIFFNK